MAYTVLALDLDGTLTNSKKQVTSRSKEAIQAASDRGVCIVLASGRPVLGIAPIAKELDLFGKNAYMLAYNGAQLVSCETGRVVWERTVSLQAIQSTFAYARSQHLAALAYDEVGVITEMSEDRYVFQEAFNNAIPIRSVDDLAEEIKTPQPKVMIVGDPLRLQVAQKELQTALGNLADVSFSEPYFMEITAKGVQKASSLDVLLELLKTSREHLMVIGDGLNDIPMLDIASMAVVMDNASEDVKAHAKDITTSNDEEGVALAIEKHILSLV
ncbi:MAG: Cof-type HAD-IIB family hydrolase [Sphaerochaeta sp.]|nr:Cof-type HAD-IIB family hydrolase [Sphaerochaeta sp.]